MKGSTLKLEIVSHNQRDRLYPSNPGRPTKYTKIYATLRKLKKGKSLVIHCAKSQNIDSIYNSVRTHIIRKRLNHDLRSGMSLKKRCVFVRWIQETDHPPIKCRKNHRKSCKIFYGFLYGFFYGLSMKDVIKVGCSSRSYDILIRDSYESIGFEIKRRKIGNFSFIITEKNVLDIFPDQFKELLLSLKKQRIQYKIVKLPISGEDVKCFAMVIYLLNIILPIFW